MILKQIIKYDNTPALEATWVNENDVVIKCHAYSNHPEQIAMLRADLGADAADHEVLIAEVTATYVPPEPEPELSQFEKDRIRYQKRASVKDSLIAYMAADNMSRVRSGEWSVQDLYNLLQDANIAETNTCMSTLSFELAATCISNVTNPLLTKEIKTDWIARLTEHFYLQG